MKHLGQLAALLGLGAAVWLFCRDDPATVFGLMRAAGAGLILAGAAHVLPMIATARDWQSLIVAEDRPDWAKMLQLVWIRESVNGLLPVARIGGEITSFRLLRRHRVPGAAAVASLVVDTQLTVISQALFTLLAIGYLLQRSASVASHLAVGLSWAMVAAAPVLLMFALVQHAKPFERIGRLISRFASGHIAELFGDPAQIDHLAKRIWSDRPVILRYLFLWQPLQCLGTAVELWLALWFFQARVSLPEAIAIEVLIQAISSAAFFVPAGLGVQEAGFVAIGGALGLDPSTSLALAGAMDEAALTAALKPRPNAVEAARTPLPPEPVRRSAR